MTSWKKPFATLTRGFGRQEKTDNLDETLQNVARQLDQMDQACHDVGKKLGGCLRTRSLEGDKKFQKLPEWLLGQTMLSSSKLTAQQLGGVLGVCGQLHLDLAVQTVTSEDQIEQVSLGPLQNFERDIQNLHKTRKQYDKLTKDLESAKSKYNAARLSKADVSDAKLNVLLQEMDDAEHKLEQCRVQYSTELYSLVPRESELSNSFMQLLQSQATYYRSCLELVEKALHDATNKAQESDKSCVFGRGLEDHLRATGRDVAFVLEECITFLMPHLDEEGLFRIAGGAGQVKLIKAALDAGSPLSTVDVRDTHCISSLLKQYLRELPEPLLTFSLYDHWVQAMNAPIEQRVMAVKMTCDRLPARNRDNLRYLMQFLAEFSQHSSRSKMTVMNIGVVIGPCLLWAPPHAAESSAGAIAHVNGLAETMINSFDVIFPEGVSSMENSGVQVDKFTKGHSRGLSAGSAASVVPTHQAKSLSDVADMVSKSPQVAALDLNYDETSSPRNMRKKKQAPMPPQPTLLDTPQSTPRPALEPPKINSLGRGVPPQRPEKPRLRVSADECETSSDSSEPATAEHNSPAGDADGATEVGTIPSSSAEPVKRQVSKPERPDKPPPPPVHPTDGGSIHTTLDGEEKTVAKVKVAPVRPDRPPPEHPPHIQAAEAIEMRAKQPLAKPDRPEKPQRFSKVPEKLMEVAQGQGQADDRAGAKTLVTPKPPRPALPPTPTAGAGSKDSNPLAPLSPGPDSSHL